MPFMRYAAFLSAASLALAAPLNAQNSEGTTVTQPTSPPTAEKREHSYSHHGITISDPYHWLKDQSYPTIDDEDVLDHLKAENAWFEARMKPQQELVDSLFEEMKARIKEDDSTVPQRRGDYLYWSEFEEGAEYRKYYRRPVAGGSPDLILDENLLADGLEYFRLGAFSVSQNGRYLAYSADTNGSERFTARIKDLETGELLPDEIPGTLSGLVWVKNDTALVYGTADENWRVHDATMHVLGTPVSKDVELYRETQDEGFRADASMETLGALRAIDLKRDPDAIVTAGNASQQNDAAAGCLVVAEDKVEELGLEPILWFHSWSAAGCDPSRMGIGPVPAVERLFARNGLGWDDIGLIELNEAFAPQALAVLKGWGFAADDSRRELVNVNGSGISLGHPIGATGIRILADMAHEMQRREVRYGLETMCIGGGQGMAAVFERAA